MHHVTQYRNLGTLHNDFGSKRAIRSKFDTVIEDGPSLRTDHKATLKWAWPGLGLRDLIYTFWDLLNIF